MSYHQRGKVFGSGITNLGGFHTGHAGMTVLPDDDGLHITGKVKGDFEWWYFDITDPEQEIFLKIVFHIGTDPLRTRVFPQLAVSVNIRSDSVNYTLPFRLNEIRAEGDQCHITTGDLLQIKVTGKEPLTYVILTDMPEFRCNLIFTGNMEGWKPLGNSVPCEAGKKRSEFSWIIPMPRATVSGEFVHKGKTFRLTGATGYHDHNFIKVDPLHPLYLDNLINRWYWGKCRAGRFTVIFMDTWFRTNRIQSLMVAENDRIIHSSNNLTQTMVTGVKTDPELKAEYPVSLLIRSLDPSFPLQLTLNSTKILDKRDLLHDVGSFIKWLIKTFMTKPVYFGVEAVAALDTDEGILRGIGNYEAMIFRNSSLPD